MDASGRNPRDKLTKGCQGMKENIELNEINDSTPIYSFPSNFLRNIVTL